jgi:hypothetical protein
MNQKCASKGAPDVRRLRDNELDAIAGGSPGTGTLSGASGDAISNLIDSLSKELGTPAR